MNFYNLANKKLTKIFIILLSIFALSGCSYLTKKKDSQSNEQSEIVKKKRIDPNVFNRAEDQKNKNLIFGEKSQDKFGNQNVMWIAALETLENMPISLADYSGSIISTDWYSPKNSNESIKIQIKFVSNEISPNSMKINSFKKICSKNSQNCNTQKLDNNFNSKIKESIIKKIREIQIKKSE